MWNCFLYCHLHLWYFASPRCHQNPLPKYKQMYKGHDGKERKDNLVPKYRGVYHAFREIFAEEGIQGIFKGFHVSILTQALASSIFFWLYFSSQLVTKVENKATSTIICPP